jgi:hypothetical protein
LQVDRNDIELPAPPQTEAHAAAVSADPGYADAQNNIAMGYQQGRGVPKGRTRALLWFRRAAEQVSPKHNFMLQCHTKAAA